MLIGEQKYIRNNESGVLGIRYGKEIKVKIFLKAQICKEFCIANKQDGKMEISEIHGYLLGTRIEGVGKFIFENWNG